MAASTGNAIIQFPRHSSLVTFSGGSAASGYPVTNLGTDDLAQVYRTADLLAASTTFIGTLSAAVPANFFGLVDHNISTFSATYRLRCWSDAARTVLTYDTGTAEVWPVVYPRGTLPYGDPHFITGRYVQTDLANGIWTLGVVLTGVPPICRAFQLDITDPSNPAGYVQAGRCEIGLQWQVFYAPDNGMQFGAPARTLMQQAKGGVKRFERLAKAQIYRGQISHLPRDETMSIAFEQQRQMDIDTPFLVWMFPAETVQKARTLLYVRHAELGLFTYNAYGYNTTPVAFEQVL